MSTLKLTHDEVRTRETAHVGTTDRPYALWPGGPATNDCVGFQTAALGLRTGRETLAQLHPHWISIAAFRAHYQWREVPADQIVAGDLIAENWTGTRTGGRLEPEHLEWAYSVNHGAGTVVIVSANTGPRPGDATPNGIWKKTRPLDAHILFGIRPPYRDARPTAGRKAVVKTVARFVNEHVDDKDLRRTTAAGPGPNTGLEGPNYWRLVQTWGREHGYYPSRFVIDGIAGPQSRIVEAAAHKAATAKK